VLLDSEGRCVGLSPEAAELLGVPAAALAGQRFIDLGPWATDPFVHDAVAAVCRGLPAGPHATAGDISLRLHPLPSGPWALAELEDPRLLRRQRATDDATAVLAAIGRLSTGIGHDVNNTLASIQTCFLLVRDGIPADHPFVKFVPAIDHEIDRLATISRRLHRFYRLCLDPGDGTTAAGLVNEAVEMFRETCSADTVTLVIDGSAARELSTPGALLRHAVFGLLSAAAAVAPPEGALAVHAAAEPGKLRVTIRGALPEPALLDALKPIVESGRPARALSAMSDVARSLLDRAMTALGGTVAVGSLSSGETELRLEVPLP
jgi:signal transduction histidine kinase